MRKTTTQRRKGAQHLDTTTVLNCVVRYVDIRHTENGPICRVHFTGDYSESLISSMADELGWTPLPKCSSSMKLDGKLIGGENFILKPNGGLAKNVIDVPAFEASDFEAKRIKKGEDSTEDILSFVIRSNHVKAAIELWDFMSICGKADGVLKFRYAHQVRVDDEEEAGEEKPDEQPSLPGVDAKKPGKGRKPGKTQQIREAVASVED